jgi:uncharacterized damage-inducible protein DinB
MIPRTVLIELYGYNYWARDRQLADCAALTNEQFLRPMGSSFSSLRDTLAHLVAVEWVWQERWSGRSPTREEYLRDWGPERFPTVASVRERWAEVERQVRVFLRQLTEEKASQPLSYTNIKGEKWTYPLWQTLWHVVNHQTYHRGQVTTLLRQLGAKAQPLDFLVAIDGGLLK